jgi:hypothetical protein
MIQPVLTRPSDPVFNTVLNSRLAEIASQLEALSKAQQTAAATTGASGPSVSTSGGTRKQRLAYPPGQLDTGSPWWETDTGLLYVVNVATAEAHKWQYAAGVQRGTLAAKPTGLGADDTGLLYYATDYARTWRWSGSAWANAPGEMAQGAIAYFDANPGTGWSIADGTTVTYSTTTAGTTSKAKPNAVGAYIKGAASYTGTQTAASGLTDPNGATTTVQSGTGVSVASPFHQHSLASVDPAHISAIPYVRL